MTKKHEKLRGINFNHFYWIAEDLFGMDENKSVKCRHCSWEGKIMDIEQKRVNSSPESWDMLCGREGYEYRCPRCKWIVETYYTRMS